MGVSGKCKTTVSDGAYKLMIRKAGYAHVLCCTSVLVMATEASVTYCIVNYSLLENVFCTN